MKYLTRLITIALLAIPTISAAKSPIVMTLVIGKNGKTEIYNLQNYNDQRQCWIYEDNIHKYGDNVIWNNYEKVVYDDHTEGKSKYDGGDMRTTWWHSDNDTYSIKTRCDFS